MVKRRPVLNRIVEDLPFEWPCLEEAAVHTYLLRILNRNTHQCATIPPRDSLVIMDGNEHVKHNSIITHTGTELAQPQQH